MQAKVAFDRYFQDLKRLQRPATAESKNNNL